MKDISYLLASFPQNIQSSYPLVDESVIPGDLSAISFAPDVLSSLPNTHGNNNHNMVIRQQPTGVHSIRENQGYGFPRQLLVPPPQPRKYPHIAMTITVPAGCTHLQIVHEDCIPPQISFLQRPNMVETEMRKEKEKQTSHLRTRNTFHPAEKMYILRRFKYYRKNFPQLRINQIAYAIWRDSQSQFYNNEEEREKLKAKDDKMPPQRSYKSICTLLYNYRDIFT